MENQHKAKMNNVGGMAQTRWNDLKAAVLAEANEQAIENFALRYHEAHGEYLKAAYLYGKMAGIKNENVHFLGMVDELVKAAGGSKAEEALLAAKGNGKVKFNA
jgi:predicted PolB exonuclease-like 3'-5' exonuclease